MCFVLKFTFFVDRVWGVSGGLDIEQAQFVGVCVCERDCVCVCVCVRETACVCVCV